MTLIFLIENQALKSVNSDTVFHNLSYDWSNDITTWMTLIIIKMRPDFILQKSLKSLVKNSTIWKWLTWQNDNGIWPKEKGGKLFLFSKSLCNVHGLRTPNEGINQRYMKNWADVADKICFGCNSKFGIWIEFSATQWRLFPLWASVVRGNVYIYPKQTMVDLVRSNFCP